MGAGAGHLAEGAIDSFCLQSHCSGFVPFSVCVTPTPEIVRSQSVLIVVSAVPEINE